MSRATGAESRIPYLDGLRAYSILLVMFDHTLAANSWLLPKWYLQIFMADGLLGVRVFFVLSGFLITTLLLKEEDGNGRISIRGFYERRIARIFPAFYLYFFTIVVLTALHFMAVPRASFYAAATFTWNFATFWRHGGPSDLTGVFGHIWSLSIEEQFYLLWPSFLVFLGRRWTLRLAAVCVIVLPFLRLGAFSLMHSGLLRTAILDRTAQDMIMWGCLGAFAVRSGLLERLRVHRFRSVMPWMCGVVVFGLSAITRVLPELGLQFYLLPTAQCLGALLFMSWLLSGKDGLVRRGLEAWPVVQLGLLSYSLYLWQQLFTLWPGMDRLGLGLKLLLPFLVAIGSYRLVEVPMRRLIRRWFSQPQRMHSAEAGS